MTSMSYMKRVLKDAKDSGIELENCHLLEEKIELTEKLQTKVELLCKPFSEDNVRLAEIGLICRTTLATRSCV